MNNPLFSWMEATDPQTKPERGYFLRTRYQINRKITITGLEYDQWTRAADGQNLKRLTARMEYAPIWPLRFRIRYRVSSRAWPDQVADFRRFNGYDLRFQTRVRLSAWDELRFLYSVTNTRFAARPRLTGAAEPDPPGNPSSNMGTPLAQASSPSQALQGMLVHNPNERLQFIFSSILFRGFLWNFEDNEFVVIDGEGIRNFIVVSGRLGQRLVMRFKFTTDHRWTRSNVDIREFNEPFGPRFEGSDVRRMTTAFRLQFDYNF
jgi:hypothetical protein